jgi:hypothetical protein
VGGEEAPEEEERPGPTSTECARLEGASDAACRVHHGAERAGESASMRGAVTCAAWLGSMCGVVGMCGVTRADEGGERTLQG